VRKRTIWITLALSAIVALGVSLLGVAAAAKRRHARDHVRLAWPYTSKGRPADPLAQWLAQQAGPVCPKHKRHRNCPRLGQPRHARRTHRAEAARIPAVDRGPKRYDADPVARIASSGSGSSLALTRSYEIPSADPSYNRLLNWSWTYDSAVTAASFVALANKSQAAQLLDQLAALQNADGSIDIAFDVSTGRGAGMSRAGTIAWVGLAATKFDGRFGVSTYRTMAKKAADYLLTLQEGNGLIRGGPGLTWFSTQHNLLAYTFLGHLALELNYAGDSAGYLKYGTAARNIADAIKLRLVKSDLYGTRFIQGLNDSVEPLDVQPLGAMFEVATGDILTAKAVLSYAKSKFLVTGRSIVKSTNAATYNNTYSATGPFSGYKPYAEASSPNVLWFEGTPMLRIATASVGDSTTTLDSWITAWKATTASTVGPVQSDQTLTAPAYGVEYHVWPSAAPAAWVLISQNATSFFTAY